MADNANITVTTGTIAINADTAGSGSASFSQASTGSTITSTNTGTSAVAITVNTIGGGTGNASIRTIADSGTLTVQTYGGSILYAGTDTLDVQQSANYTLFPGITGPAPSLSGSGSGPSGSSGSAPTGTIKAVNYVFSTSASGGGSIGTVARPINTSTPSTNTETLTAGSGGIYFVDWGNPLTLDGATATGAGNVEVVAANAGSHNLTVAGTVTTGSGNIVLAADDNFLVNSGVTIGGSGFSGDVYLACNRDTGNTETLTDSGTITTTNATASAVVIEGFHDPISGNTDAGVVSVGNVTVGNGGTITVDTVPYDMTNSGLVGQGDIVAPSTSTVLNAGASGTVNLIATSMAGLSATSAVGISTLPITVTAGTVNVTANVGTLSGSTSYADSAYVTDTIAGNFTATTGSTSPSGNIALTTTSGALTVNGATSTGNSSPITLIGAGGVVLNATLGSSTTGAIAISGPLSGSGAIVEGTGAVTITQNSDSSYDGAISGTQNVIKAGTGNLTLTGAETYTGETYLSAGALTYAGAASSAGGGSLNVGNATGQCAVLNVNTTGALSFGTTSGVVTIGDTGSSGAINQTSGLFNALGSVTSSVYLTVGNGGYGSYNLSGGTLTVGNSSNQDGGVRVGATASTGQGVFAQSGGTVNVARYFTTGTSSGTGVATFTGGTFNSSTTYSILAGDSGAGAVGTVNIGTEAGGSAAVISQATQGFLVSGGTGTTGILNLNAGTLQMTNGSVGEVGTAATLNLNGGTLQAGAAGLTLANSTLPGNVYMGGLTIDTQTYSATMAAAMVATSGNGIYPAGGALAIGSGGGSGYIGAPLVAVSGDSGTGAMAVATISGGVVTGVTLTNPGQNYQVGDQITFAFTGGGYATAATNFVYTLTASDVAANATGGLTKIGTGTLILSGTNTYTGATTVSGGVLSVSSDANLGAVPGSATAGSIVLNGGTLLASANFTLSSNRGIAVGPTSGTGAGEIDVAAGSGADLRRHYRQQRRRHGLPDGRQRQQHRHPDAQRQQHQLGHGHRQCRDLDRVRQQCGIGHRQQRRHAVVGHRDHE